MSTIKQEIFILIRKKAWIVRSACSLDPEIGNWQLAVGSWQSETGKWQLSGNLTYSISKIILSLLKQ
jgi:hypothetical protein